MAIIKFDTHSFIKKFNSRRFYGASGCDISQGTLVENRLATKHDIKMLDKDIKAMGKDLRREFDLELALQKSEFIKWIVSVSATQAAVILAALKFLH